MEQEMYHVLFYPADESETLQQRYGSLQQRYGRMLNYMLGYQGVGKNIKRAKDKSKE